MCKKLYEQLVHQDGKRCMHCGTTKRELVMLQILPTAYFPPYAQPLAEGASNNMLVCSTCRRKLLERPIGYGQRVHLLAKKYNRCPSYNYTTKPFIDYFEEAKRQGLIENVRRENS